MKLLFLLFVGFVVLPQFGASQVKHTENTLKLAEGAAGEKATIDVAAWLAGSWVGTGLGGVSEETWSKAAGGIMVGTYRLIKKDKPVFYEILWMMEQDETLILRLKHFHSTLVGWEEKDRTVDFKFVKKDGKRIYFSGLTFENTNGSELNIYLALRQKDGALKEESFKMKRSN
ncbi:MAG: DUF6265 family protein [Pyrinomonadaceae bacterium]